MARRQEVAICAARVNGGIARTQALQRLFSALETAPPQYGQLNVISSKFFPSKESSDVDSNSPCDEDLTTCRGISSPSANESREASVPSNHLQSRTTGGNTCCCKYHS